MNNWEVVGQWSTLQETEMWSYFSFKGHRLKINGFSMVWTWQHSWSGQTSHSCGWPPPTRRSPGWRLRWWRLATRGSTPAHPPTAPTTQSDYMFPQVNFLCVLWSYKPTLALVKKKKKCSHWRIEVWLSAPLRPTDRPTDGPTHRTTDRPTDCHRKFTLPKTMSMLHVSG